MHFAGNCSNWESQSDKTDLDNILENKTHALFLFKSNSTARVWDIRATPNHRRGSVKCDKCFCKLDAIASLFLNISHVLSSHPKDPAPFLFLFLTESWNVPDVPDALTSCRIPLIPLIPLPLKINARLFPEKMYNQHAWSHKWLPVPCLKIQWTRGLAELWPCCLRLQIWHQGSQGFTSRLQTSPYFGPRLMIFVMFNLKQLTAVTSRFFWSKL